MQCLLLLLVPLLAVASGVAMSSPPGADEVLLGRSMALAIADSRPCTLTCDGKPVDGDVYNHECFGLFKMWCGPRPAAPSEEPKHELSGLLCNGHFKALTADVPWGPDGALVPSLVTVCEGMHHWVASHISTCQHTNHTSKKMMGVVVAGEVVSVMSRPSGAPSSVQRQQEVEAAVAPWRQVLDELQRLNVPPSARQVQGPSTFKLQSKHQGFKVEWKVTKRLPPSSSSSPIMDDTLESLDQQAKEMLAPTWRDWLPGGAPQPPPRRGDDDTFELLCNGKPAWLHGAVPCWGNFTVAGKHTSAAGAPSASSANGKKPCGGARKGGMTMAHHSKLRHLMADPQERAQGQAMHASQASKDQVATLALAGTTHSVSMKAECDGFWSGILGHTCHGVSTSRLEVEVEGQAKVMGAVRADQDQDDEDDDEPALSKYSVCTGHQSVRFLHHDVVGMAITCKGGSVLSMEVTLPPRP